MHTLSFHRDQGHWRKFAVLALALTGYGTYEAFHPNDIKPYTDKEWLYLAVLAAASAVFLLLSSLRAFVPLRIHISETGVTVFGARKRVYNPEQVLRIDVYGEGEDGEGTDLVITLEGGRRIRRRGPFIEPTTTRRLPPCSLYDQRYTNPLRWTPRP